MVIKKRTDKFIDDGHTICDMNIEGMPWYIKNERPKETEEKISLTKAEERAFMGGIMKATFLIVSAFAVSGFLFILFATNIWLK